MKYTTETYIEKANKIHNNKYDYGKTIFKSKGHVIIKCPLHNFEFTKRVDEHLKGRGCTKCISEEKSKRQSQTKEYSIAKAIEKHGSIYDYSLIENYTNQTEVYNLVCKSHGIFPIRFDHHIEGRGCKKCARENTADKLRLPLTEVLEKIKNIHGDKYGVENLKYKGANYKMYPTCKIHGQFPITPFEFFNGANCIYCGVTVSKPELEVKTFIQQFVEAESSNRKILKNKFELDIYIPTLKAAVEFNGLYFHSDEFHKMDSHLNKTMECQGKGIKLIHIFEDEWKDKKEIVKSLLLESIDKTENKVSVEDCEIKIVDQKEYRDFLESNYIDDFVEANVIVGLYHENELVSLISEKNKELLFVNKLNTIVDKGFEKLLENFKGEYVTTVDLRWSYGEREKALGFKVIEQTPPAYFFTKGQVRTKKEIKGYNKIYDCGTLKLSNLL